MPAPARGGGRRRAVRHTYPSQLVVHGRGLVAATRERLVGFWLGLGLGLGFGFGFGIGLGLG